MSEQSTYPSERWAEPPDRPEQVQILYVEDDAAFADLAVRCLENETDRFSVQRALSASKGLERLGDDIDCIVSDYNMPGMDGIEFLTAVRESYPDLPFILFTGKGSEEIASEAISAGVTDYLQKESGTDQFAVLANRIANVVEKERVQERLTKQDKQLDTVLSHSPIISFAFDADGVFTLSRGKALDNLGFMPGEVVGESVFDVFADNPDIIAAAETALDGEQTKATHEVAGAVYQTTYNPVFDDDGTVSTVTGVAIDITERHEREQELRKFKEAIEATSHSVYITDADGTIEYVNPAFETTTGYSAEEAIGQTPRILKSGEHDEEFYEELWDTILAGDTWEGELINSTKDGDRYVINQTITPVIDDAGEITNFVAVNRDITERVERERELEILRQAIDCAHIPLVLSDPSREDNPLVYVNDAFEEVTGYAQSEAVGRNCRFLQGQGTDPDRVATLRKAVDNEEQVTVELRNYRKDGEMFWNQVTVRPIYDEDGSLLRYFGSQQDITERKESQERLERQNDRLAEFAQTVSHDLRNPLRVADGRLELASEECDSEHLDAAADALDRSQTLIDDLLTLARNGITVEETEPVELAAIVEQCDWLTEAPDTSLGVETEPTIVADPGRLRQLVENLLRNAVEHGGDGVDITVGELHETPGFYIADDGPGIPSEEREQVFESGYSTADDGTGFGLAIVQEIVREHGWEIRVTESTAGGARFEITGVEFAEG